jgi:outer membrane receptor protein involved in Fe transport
VVAGAEFSYRLKGNHGLSVGAQYKNLDQKQSLFQGAKVREDYALLMAFHPIYVTNSKLNRVYYHLSRIDMLETFAQYQYQIHPNWQLSAGLRVGILLQSLTNDPNKKSYSLSQQGLAPLDFGLTWGVDWKINRHWSLGLQYGQGLRNLSKRAEDKTSAVTTFENTDLVLPNDPANINVLVEQGNDYQNFVRIPVGLRNTDLQLLLKFRF